LGSKYPYPLTKKKKRNNQKKKGEKRTGGKETMGPGLVLKKTDKVKGQVYQSGGP